MAKDVVTVVWSEQAIQPVQFNVIRFGGFSMTTEVRDGETPEQAMDRAYAYLDKFAKKNWKQTLDDYLLRLDEAGKSARIMSKR